MPTPFTRQQPSLGKYQALSEQEQEQEQDNVEFISSTARERERANQKSTQVCIVFLYYFLAAFGGFLFAIALVNFYPGAVGTGDGVGGNARLKALLSVPREGVTFTPNEKFSSPPNRENNALWNELLGPSIGLIALNNSKAYGLPDGAKAVNDDTALVYQVTFAHQLNCLSLIRSVYFSENKGIFNTTTPTPSLVVVQANQCFDFLVQSIKCNADLSLESKTDEGGNFRGWGESRTCKRWESVMDFMGRHRYKEAEKAIDHHAHGDDDDEEDEHHHG